MTKGFFSMGATYCTLIALCHRKTDKWEKFISFLKGDEDDIREESFLSKMNIKFSWLTVVKSLFVGLGVSPFRLASNAGHSSLYANVHLYSTFVLCPAFE